MNYDSIIIGHVCLDVNIDHMGNTEYLTGGAAIHSSASAHALGGKVLVITKTLKEDKKGLKKAFALPYESVIHIPSSVTTSIQNTYHTEDKEKRTCLCIAQADPFTSHDIPKDINSKVYHLAGLIYGDYADGMIEELSKRGKVALDVQGVLRHKTKSGKMVFKDWEAKQELLPYIHFLKTDAAEAKILTGETNRIKAAKMLYDWGAKEVMITHNSEVILYDGNQVYSYPLKPRNLSGRTGRGDTTFAAYIIKRLSSTIETALLYAAATVSLKMEKPGPFRGSKADIEKYLNTYYKKFL